MMDPEFLFADGYDDCIIGMSFRDAELVVLYSSDKVIEKLSEQMTEEEAFEFFEFNVAGAYVGPKTPVFFP
jgi:hypothetical protein